MGSIFISHNGTKPTENCTKRSVMGNFYSFNSSVKNDKQIKMQTGEKNTRQRMRYVLVFALRVRFVY